MMMQSEVDSNIKKLFENLPDAKETFKKLGESNIKYGIFAGAHVSLLTSNREPTDVDILVSDDDFPKLSEILDGRVEDKEEENAVSELFYLKNTDVLEFVSRLDFIINGNHYPIRLTPLSWQNILKFTVDGVDVILLNPVDTILEKAIMPRGAEVGKHDLEDIEAIMNKLDIDKEYLLKRVKEMKAEKIIIPVLQKYGIDFSSE